MRRGIRRWSRGLSSHALARTQVCFQKQGTWETFCTTILRMGVASIQYTCIEIATYTPLPLLARASPLQLIQCRGIMRQRL